VVRHGRNHPISTGATAWSSDNLSARIHVRHGTTDGTEELHVKLPVSKPNLYSLFSDWFYSVQKLIQTSIKSGDLDIHGEKQRVHSGVGDYNAA